MGNNRMGNDRMDRASRCVTLTTKKPVPPGHRPIRLSCFWDAEVGNSHRCIHGFWGNLCLDQEVFARDGRRSSQRCKLGETTPQGSAVGEGPGAAVVDDDGVGFVGITRHSKLAA